MFRETTTLCAVTLTAFICACSADPAAPVSGSGGSKADGGGSGGTTTVGSGGTTTVGSGGTTTSGSGGTTTSGSGGAIADASGDSVGALDVGGAAGSDGGAPTSVFAEACALAAKVRCERLEECVQPIFHAFYGDQARCQSDEAVQCVRYKDLPSTKATPSDLIACTKANQAANCDDWQAYDEYDELEPAACKLIPGTAANGAGCAVNRQCMSGYCQLGAGTCGLCRAKVAIGRACPETDACVDGAYCKGGKCLAKGASGAICEDAVECQDGMQCFNSGCGKGAPVGAACQDSGDCGFNVVCRNRKCVHVGKGGDACSINPDNDEDSCGEGYSCGPGGKCVAVAVAKAGEPCNQSLGLYCDRDSACSGDVGAEGTCLAVVPIGATCNPNRDYCAVPADCVGGKCTVVDLKMCK